MIDSPLIVTSYFHKLWDSQVIQSYILTYKSYHMIQNQLCVSSILAGVKSKHGQNEAVQVKQCTH